MTKRAELEALPAWKAWADEVTALAGAAGSIGQVHDLLTEWAREASDDQEITASLYRTLLHGDMAGQMFVRTIEVPEADGPAFTLDDPPPTPPFLRQSFSEALEAFRARRIVSPGVFEAMDAQARTRAFTATRLASETLINRAFDLLERTIAEGGTLRDFQRAFAEADLGITPVSPHYLENVYRTNVQLAYGAGRQRQLEHPAVMQARPLVEYRTAGDSRVRPAHAALDGLVFDRTTDDGWKQIAPPNGYMCRCSFVARRESQVDMSRLTKTNELPEGAGPDAGWLAAPAG